MTALSFTVFRCWTNISRTGKIIIPALSVFQRIMAIYPGANRISLMFSVSHKPGSLYHMIAKFAALDINLTKLESRPIPGKDFEFLFYFDMEASVWSEKVMRLLAELSSGNELFVFLGCYSEI